MRRLFRYRIEQREGLILQENDRFGEIAPLPGFSKETLDEAMKETIKWIRESKVPTLPSVRFGISCLQKPLNSIRRPLCALGAKEGFDTVKLKMAQLSVEEALTLIQSQKGKVLRLDFNRAWDLAKLLELARHFKPQDFAYWEEPAKTVEELTTFSKKTGFPIALDESIGIDTKNIPSLCALVVKPTILGDIPTTSLPVVLSSSYESGLGLLHIAHLPGVNPVGLDTVFQEDLLTSPIRCERGWFIWEKKEPLLNMSKLCPVL